MKKTMKLLAAALAGTLVLGGCAGNKETTAASAESETVKETEAQSTEAESSQAEAETEKEETETSDAAGSGTAIRVGSLKGHSKTIFKGNSTKRWRCVRFTGFIRFR